MLLTLRGTPFLYAGEELGLLDAVIPPERAVDPGGRDGCRGPIPWVSQVPDHGWNSPWLPLAANAASHNAELAEADGFSMLHLYRRLLQVRRSSAALSHGAFTWIDSPADVLAYRRSLGAESFVVMANMSDQPASILWPNTPTMATRSMTENSLAGYSAAIFNTSQL